MKEIIVPIVGAVIAAALGAALTPEHVGGALIVAPIGVAIGWRVRNMF